jgi:glycosyltransferase involved in cell wall biosynthesis
MKVHTPLTIAYFTCRKDPKVEWFFRSLNRELGGDWEGVNIMIVDYWFQYNEQERQEYYQGIHTKYTNNVIILSPKPCPIQGKYKVTSNEYFAASNARNTAFINCKTDYIVCIDDLTVIKEGWLDIVLWGQLNNHVILGSYAKVKNLQCNEDGTYTYDEDSLTQGLDSRYTNPYITNPTATQVGGSWLFGCSFGLPLSLALHVDGFDEACDGQGAEDYDFGIRLGRVTRNIFYSKQMFTYEDDDLHFAPGNQKFIRDSKILTPDTLMKNRIGRPSDHAMLDHVLASKTPFPFIPSNLNILRKQYHDSKVPHDVIDFVDTKDWRDGQPYKEM